MLLLIIPPARLCLRLLILTRFPQIQPKVSGRFHCQVVSLNYSRGRTCAWVLSGAATSLVHNLSRQENKFCFRNNKKTRSDLFGGDNNENKQEKKGHFSARLRFLAPPTDCHLKRHLSPKHLRSVVRPCECASSECTASAVMEATRFTPREVGLAMVTNPLPTRCYEPPLWWGLMSSISCFIFFSCFCSSLPFLPLPCSCQSPVTRWPALDCSQLCSSGIVFKLPLFPLTQVGSLCLCSVMSGGPGFWRFWVIFRAESFFSTQFSCFAIQLRSVWIKNLTWQTNKLELEIALKAHLFT